jgi:hypothetical protein
MSAHRYDAERLRHHLHDLSSAVARRLIGVLDTARDGKHELSHEFNAVVCEITAIQRELVDELTGPHAVRSADMATMGRLLELHDKAVRLLEHLEALLAQPAYDYLGPGHPARRPRAGSGSYATASRVRAAEGPGVAATARGAPPVHAYADPYDDSRAYMPLEARAAPLPRASGAGLQRVASGASQSRFLSVPTWGLFGAALALAFALSATVGAHILSGNGEGGEGEPAQVAVRSSRLDVRVPADVETSGGNGPIQHIIVAAEPPKSILPAAKVALITETGALPEASGRAADTPSSVAGFVAVLGTYDDEAAAREAFRRLKESNTAVLATAEAQLEKVEGQGGKSWQRLSLLPAATREEAKEICRRLGEGGHTGCWVKPKVHGGDPAFVSVLATRREPAAAEEAFAQLKARFPVLLGGAEAQIETVHMQDGTTWHRLSTQPAVSRAEAKALCRRLRKAGLVGCWVKPQG